MLIDFNRWGPRYQSMMFWAVLVLTVVCFIPLAYFVMAPVFGVNPGNVASGM
jgi:succinate dehydrogenase / fumarate reductase cytochrome b subunit